jgi:hypothetical protein
MSDVRLLDCARGSAREEEEEEEDEDEEDDDEALQLMFRSPPRRAGTMQ